MYVCVYDVIGMLLYIGDYNIVMCYMNRGLYLRLGQCRISGCLIEVLVYSLFLSFYAILVK